MNRRIISPAASAAVIYRTSIFKSFTWVALVAVLGALCLSSASLRAESAAGYFKRGQTAETHEDYDAAFDNYQKAYAKDPKDLRFRTAFYRVRITASAAHVAKGHKLLQSGDAQGALSEFLHAGEIDPSNESAQQEIAKVRKKLGEAAPQGETSLAEESGNRAEIDSIAAPAELKALSNDPLTLHMTEDAKAIYQAVGKAAGINILFDPDFASKRTQVDLNSVSLLDALRILGTVTNTFWRPVTSNTIFVAANTRAKRTDLDEQAVQTFYLANAWQQNDLNDVLTAIRGIMTSIKVYAAASQNAIVARGTPDELLLVQKLVNDLDKPRAEVIVDIAILEVSKNWEQTLGIAWPSSVGVALQTASSTSSSSASGSGSTTTTTSPTLYDLSHLKATDFAVSVGSATANLLLTDSNTKLLQNPRIRATDGQKQTMKIGSKIPIATGSYSSGVAATTVSPLVQTQFQYQDVGVNIEITPTVHFDRDITLKMKIEVTSQSGSVTISGVTEPILSQRVAEQVIRLREGEASILGGIQEKQINEAWNGIPGLSSIPILRYLFGSKDKTVTDDDIVFLVVPHVVRSQSLDASNLRAVDTGVGTTSIDLRHIPSEAPSTAPAAAPAHPAPPARSTMGVVPGVSAEAAAPAALAQMKAAADANGKAAAAAVPNPPPALPFSPAPLAKPAPAADPSGGVSLALNPPSAPAAVGVTFQVPVVLTGGRDIASVPLQIKYDPAKLSLVNVDKGDFLGQDGQAVTLIHSDDPLGSIKIGASRPPGAAGVNGAGVICVLSFQAKTSGDSALSIARPTAVNSAQQQVPAKGGQIDIHVN